MRFHSRTSYSIATPSGSFLQATFPLLPRSQVKTVGLSFTLFEASSINFAIVMYSHRVHVDSRLALSQLLGITEGNCMAKKAKKAKKKSKKKKK
jgi:hypothetical protein